MTTSVLRLLRPAQWIKNLLVFLPMFFDGRMTDKHCLLMSGVAFVAFCCVASSVYCLNDVKDAEADRRHPVKHKRPVASGAVSTGRARGLMWCLMALGMSVLLCAGVHSWIPPVILFGYWILNVAYCYRLKQVALLDVMVVSLGFVLRILLGAEMCDVLPSPWIIVMTFLIAMFLAVAKRRDDALLMQKEGLAVRRASECYNVEFINVTLGVLASVTLVGYILYTLSSEVMLRFGSRNVYLTAIFVLAALMRYLQITIVFQRSGSPTDVVLRDRFLQLCVIGWLLTFSLIIYL